MLILFGTHTARRSAGASEASRRPRKRKIDYINPWHGHRVVIIYRRILIAQLQNGETALSKMRCFLIIVFSLIRIASLAVCKTLS